MGAPTAKCRNRKCEHNRRGGGRNPFEGLNSARRRQCIVR